MNDTLEFLYSLKSKGSKFGIERMKSLARILGDPQNDFPSIHVAGTNGKGSVCSMLDAIYQAHGCKVGLFTSPHLVELGERIRINGETLPFSKIERRVSELMPICRKMQSEGADWHPTFFELMTALAFQEFSSLKVDLAIIETGLGGRLDSTNVLNPMISVITSVGYDHCEILGHDIGQIAREKAGIIKKGKPVVYGWLEEIAEREVVKAAEAKGCSVHCLSSLQEFELPITNLRGSFQRRNAALARKVTEILKAQFPVDRNLVSRSLLEVKLPGRWQTICDRPTIILDACHNGHGAEASRELWVELPENTEVWFGSCEMDRAIEILPALFSKAKRLRLFELDQPRSCSHEELKSLTEDFRGDVELGRSEDLSSMLDQLSENTTLLITGSIYLVGSVLSLFSNNESGNFKNALNWHDTW